MNDSSDLALAENESEQSASNASSIERPPRLFPGVYADLLDHILARIGPAPEYKSSWPAAREMHVEFESRYGAVLEVADAEALEATQVIEIDARMMRQEEATLMAAEVVP